MFSVRMKSVVFFQSMDSNLRFCNSIILLDRGGGDRLCNSVIISNVGGGGVGEGSYLRITGTYTLIDVWESN